MKKPGYLNRICAYPVGVCWFMGGAVLDIIVIRTAFRHCSAAALGDWEVVLVLLVALLAASGLGFYLGMFTVWPLVRVFASWYNGAPLKPGDEVIVLAGPDKGFKARVYETPTGQGKWKLARLDFGEERAKRFRDIYEQYSLYKIRSTST